MGCWASREKYEVTREWGGQVGTFIISKSSALRVGGRGQGKVPEFNSWLVTKWPKTTKPAIILLHPSKILRTNVGTQIVLTLFLEAIAMSSKSQIK